MYIANARWLALWVTGLVACNNPLPPGFGAADAHDKASTDTLQPGAAAQAGTAAQAAPQQAQGATSVAGALQTAGAQAAATAKLAAAPVDKPNPREFHTDPVPEGYQRFEPPSIEVDPGDSKDWAQWVSGPLDQDYDVVDVRGVQSIGGHHALVYATTVAGVPGATRLWREEDQITSRLMGGIGGEGGANVHLPPGVVFRVKKGSYILIQTHYLNATEDKIIGRTVMDMKLEPVDESRTVASMLSSTSLAIDLPAHVQTSLDIDCKIEKDLKFLQISNHMHDYGIAQRTDFVDPDGTSHLLVDDKTWSGDLALNPNFTKFTLQSPAIVPKGSLLRTRCTWNNTTDKEIKFPNEMCVFFGFIVNENDIYCTDGKWSESKSFGGTEDMAGSGATATADAGVAAGAQAGNKGDAGMTGDAVGCTSSADQAIMNADTFDQKSTQCATPCGLDPDVASCTAPCFEKDVGLSHACALCNATNVACGAMKCLSECLTDSASKPCRSCVMSNCDAAFHMCTGT